LHDDSEEPEIVEELGAGRLDDLEEARQNRGPKCNHESLRLEQIGEEEARRLLVEAEFLFEDERAVVGRGQAEKLRHEAEGEEEQDGVGDLAREAFGGQLSEPCASQSPQLGQHIELIDADVGEQRVQVGDEPKLGLRTAICLRLVENFLANLVLQGFRRFGPLEHLVLS